MKYILSIVILFVCFVPDTLFAQTYVWVRSLQGFGTSSVTNLDPGMSLCHGVAVDSDQNVFICGQSNDSVDFDPGPQIEYRVSDARNLFFAKYDSAGNYLWAHVLISEHNGIATDIAVDADNNLILTGYAVGATDFDPCSEEQILGIDSTGGGFAFLAKYNPGGELIWAKQFVGDYGVIPNKLCIDPVGNIYFTGRFYGFFDVDPGTETDILDGTNGGAFFAKFDSDGDLIWGHALSGIGNLGDSKDISLAQNGDVLIAGYFDYDVDFDPGPQEFILTAETVADRFFARYTPSGEFLWAKRLNLNAYGCCSPSENINIRENSKGDILIAGNFNSTADFDPGSGHAYLSGGLSTSSFFARYDSLGNYISAKGIRGFCPIYDMHIDCHDNLYLTGSLGSADFDPGPGIVTLASNIPSASTHFLAKYDPEGNYISVKQVGGSSSGPLISTMAFTENYQYLAGGFRYSVDFDPDSTEAILTMSGIGWNGYFAKYRLSDYSVEIDTPLCSNQSILLDAARPQASYLWQDGSTDPQFIASEAGLFSVEIYQPNCTSTLNFQIYPDSLLPINLGNDTAICLGDRLYYNLLPKGGDILWQDGSKDSIYSIGDSGVFWVNIENTHCSFRDSIVISMTDCEVLLQMPNVFTPNGDGKNDFFAPLKIKGILAGRIEIYNRWGKRVFESDSILNGWNGYIGQNLASAGEYQWIILYTTIHEKAERKAGMITLLY